MRQPLAPRGLLVEPPKDADPAHLDPAFGALVAELLVKLADAGQPFRLDEGYRTAMRQKWHWGSGRPEAIPYGRPGRRVTKCDGVVRKSRHQSGRAADLYPVGLPEIPPATIVREGVEVLHPIWDLLANAAASLGLVSGARWRAMDCPHVEAAS